MPWRGQRSKELATTMKSESLSNDKGQSLPLRHFVGHPQLGCEDIPLLVSYFVQKFAKQTQKEIESVPSAAMKGLTAWEWPGNIRELENFIERAVILTRGKALEVPLTELRKTETETVTNPAVINKKRTARKALSSRPEINAGADEYERKQREEIIQALTACKGRIGGTDGAAIRMGINRTTLMYRMRKLGIYAKLFS